ncbi:MAG TPA: hypothetical protein VG942_17380 [Hyphomonadaceae bacterium]|nr:hypothetical protein [Hyphomonadaceae bacterium]
MILRSRLALACATAVLLAACSPSGESGAASAAAQTDPMAVAKSFLAAFQKKDLKTMVVLLDDKDMVQKAIDNGPNSEAYGIVFNKEITPVLTVGDGKLEGPRYKDGDAEIKLPTTDNGRHAVMQLRQNAGKWYVHDFNPMSDEEFDALSTTG